MPGTVDLLNHQIRQIVVYTFYFCVFQMMCFKFNLSPMWSCGIFLTLYGISIYEDNLRFNQEVVPESILSLRIWANNFSLFAANLTIYALERINLMTIDIDDKVPRIPGKPRQYIIKIVPSGIRLLDDVFLGAAYYTFYFSTFATFRALVSQYRYVKRLVYVNMRWTGSGVVTDQLSTGADSVPTSNMSEMDMENMQMRH